MENKERRSDQQRRQQNDRRDATQKGSSLSGSTQRDNTSTEKAMQGGRDNASQPDTAETVDQDPGMRQKQNQGGQKDDPLAS